MPPPPPSPQAQPGPAPMPPGSPANGGNGVHPGAGAPMPDFSNLPPAIAESLARLAGVARK